jgi:hypothetical protein
MQKKLNRAERALLKRPPWRDLLLNLAITKIQQRQNLLAQDPEVAQAIANQTLYPHLW